MIVIKLPYLKCSFPNCNRTVGQHDKKRGKNKQVCERHRKQDKWMIDQWKLAQGCNNKDGHYGFECVSSNIIHPATLDINHIDGNNHNRDPENIEVLCKMCHTVVTIQSEHHLEETGERPGETFSSYDDLFESGNQFLTMIKK